MQQAISVVWGFGDRIGSAVGGRWVPECLHENQTLRRDMADKIAV